MIAQGIVKKLNETEFKINDLVFYVSDKHASGGVIYQIVEDNEPEVIASRSRTVKRNVSEWDQAQSKYVTVYREINSYGLWDDKGRKISYKNSNGYVRIKPIFEFFATPKGKKPKGKGTTLIIYYRDITRTLNKVDLVALGSKYLELGNIMRDLATRGMSDGE